ncbi:MAG: bifunctional diaminohydroxyphosphoribosylaminopyrimidine deaminase/5-amino-6-(5-phosphoribosylamino)uracil reductase RibD [Gemmatimonadaceae bacterium]
MSGERDGEYMRRALSLAERGWGQTAPNPMVGAVVVRDGEIFGEGWHHRFGEAHAEVNALRAAGDRARNSTVYVTLEPCNHWGKTPPCTDAIIASGAARVVIATHDPGPNSGGGAERLRQNGIEVVNGVREGDARELNAPFFNSFVSDRPWVTLKLALSIDGAIADEQRAPGWLTNEQSRAQVHRMRANSDAIAVGAGTYLADSPELTVRGEITPRTPPLRVVFDRSGLLERNGTAIRCASEVGFIVLRDGDTLTALRQLRSRGVESLLVEGGSGLASELLDGDLVDRLVIFQAPIVLGRGALHAFAGAEPRTARAARRLRVLKRQEFGDDLMTIYAPRAA